MVALFAAVFHCVVGSNPGSPGKEALHVLECDGDTGAARIVQTVKGIEGTTYFDFSNGGRTLWSAIREKGFFGKRSTWIVHFDVQGNRIGKMTKCCELPCETPCHIGLSPDGRHLGFAAYTSATWGTVPLQPDGDQPGGDSPLRSNGDSPRRLQAPCVSYRGTVPAGVAFCGRLADEGMGPRVDRQKKAYAHCAIFTPNGKKVGIIDLGCDAVFFYDLGGQSPLAPGGQSPLVLKADPGDGPRHAIFSKCGRYFYVLNELSSSVTGYKYDGGVKFKRIGKWPMVPEGTDPLSTKAAAIKLTADGNVLMASNRGLDSIAFFEVKDDGRLAFKRLAMLKGRFPRDFELMPGEKFMVVGHKMSNEIQVYAFDRANYTLTPVGDAIRCYRPLCFKFIP